MEHDFFQESYFIFLTSSKNEVVSLFKLDVEHDQNCIEMFFVVLLQNEMIDEKYGKYKQVQRLAKTPKSLRIV